MNERQREEEKKKPKSANITACKDKTWDGVFTFATSQLLHCYEQLIISGFKCITSKTCLYTHYDTELCNLTTFLWNCDVGNLSHWREGSWVKVQGSESAGLWSHSEQGLVNMVLPIAISTSKQPERFHWIQPVFQTRRVEMHKLEKPDMRKWLHCCLA